MKGNLSNGEFKNGCRVLFVVVGCPVVVDADDADDVVGGALVVAAVLWRRVAFWTLRLLPLVCLFFVLLFPFLAGARVVAVGRLVAVVAGVLVAAAGVAVAAAAAVATDFSVGSCLNAGTVLLTTSSLDNSIPSSSSKSLSNLLISYLSIKGVSFSVVVGLVVVVVVVVVLLLLVEDLDEAVELLTL